jgi:hypothetical protein
MKPDLGVAIVTTRVARRTRSERQFARRVDAFQPARARGLSARFVLLGEHLARSRADATEARLALPTLRARASRRDRVGADTAYTEEAPSCQSPTARGSNRRQRRSRYRRPACSLPPSPPCRCRRGAGTRRRGANRTLVPHSPGRELRTAAAREQQFRGADILELNLTPEQEEALDRAPRGAQGGHDLETTVKTQAVALQEQAA